MFKNLTLFFLYDKMTLLFEKQKQILYINLKNMSVETQRAPEVAPKQEASKDFKQLVTEAVQDKRLTKAERSEIIKLVNQMDQEKVKVHQDTINQLKKFATDYGYTWFNANLEKTLQSAGERGAVKPVEATAVSTSTDKPAEPTPAPADKPAEATPAPTPSPEPANPESEKEEAQPSVLDKARNFVSWKLDIASLPKEDQATVKDLQDAGFKLKPVEGQKWVYEVDMNGIWDKSTLKIVSPTQLDFKTNIIQQNAKDIEYSFQDTTKAKEQMTKINELYNVNTELKQLPELSWHRDFGQEDRYQTLTKQKATLEKDLGIAASAPAAAWAQWGK